MTKRLQSNYSVCKRLRNSYKNLWGIKKKNSYRCILNNRKRRRITLFGKLLNVKQSLRFFYSNVNELKFKGYINYSKKSPSKTIDKLSSILESRLDSVLFRSCFATSFLQARQLINHGFISVNNSIVLNPNKNLIKGDIIKLDINFYDIQLFRKIILSRSIPNYLQVDFNFLKVVFLWDANIKSTYYPVKFRHLGIFRYYK